MDTKKIMEYGRAAPDFERASQAADRVLRMAGKLRDRLGAKSGLLDNFMKSVLENFVDVLSVATDGIDNQFGDLRGLCVKVRNGKTDEAREHPFYEKLAAFTEKHSMPQNAHYTEVHCVGLFADYSKFALDRYIAEFDARLQKAMERYGVPEAREALIAEIGAEQAQ